MDNGSIIENRHPTKNSSPWNGFYADLYNSQFAGGGAGGGVTAYACMRV